MIIYLHSQYNNRIKTRCFSLKQRNTLLKITMCVLLLITVIIITEINSTFGNVAISTNAFGRELYITNEEAETGIDTLSKVKQDMAETMNPVKGSYINLGNRLPHKEVFDLTVFITVLAIWLLLFTTSLLIAKKNQLYVKIKEGSNEPD